jgi:hypothetical protein
MNMNANANAPVFRNGVLQAPTKRSGRGSRMNKRFVGVNEVGIQIPSKDPEDYYNVDASIIVVNTSKKGVNLENEHLKRLRNKAVDEYKIHRATKIGWGSRTLLPEFNRVSNAPNAPNATNAPNSTSKVLSFRRRKTLKRRKSSRKTRRL